MKAGPEHSATMHLGEEARERAARVEGTEHKAQAPSMDARHESDSGRRRMKLVPRPSSSGPGSVSHSRLCRPAPPPLAGRDTLAELERMEEADKNITQRRPSKA
ncbi:hypothetical protein AOLI_G00053860 [Acnodon oligacanthus]